MTWREWRRPENFRLSSDASGGLGFGVVFGNEWISENWDWVDKRERIHNIAILELVPIVIACLTWGRRWNRSRVIIDCDNMAVVESAKTFLPKDSHLCKLFRVLASLTIEHSFEIRLVHIAGKDNTDADNLSRMNISDFVKRYPEARAGRIRIPTDIINFLLDPRDRKKQGQTSLENKRGI